MKKIYFALFTLFTIFTLTACDGELTLPSGVTLPPGITTEEVTTGDLTTGDLTTGTTITTEVPTTNDGTGTQDTTTSLTTEVPTTMEPTTTEPTTIREITIIFDSQGGSDIDPIVTPETTEPQVLPTPVRSGYIFDGWYTDMNFENKFTLTNMPNESVTLYAKWILE